MDSSITRSTALALALLALQFGAIRFAPSEIVVRVILPLTIALVPVALWPHRGHRGVWVMFVGLLANLAAVVANGGLMPIERHTIVKAVGEDRAADYEAGAWIAGSKDVLLSPGEGQLVALGDSIVIHISGGGVAASPGDVVVWGGLLVLAGEASVAWQRRQRAGTADEPIPPGVRAEGSATTPT